MLLLARQGVLFILVDPPGPVKSMAGRWDPGCKVQRTWGCFAR